MPEWLRRWLEGRGLYREDMTETEARALFEKEEMKRSLPETRTETPMPAAKPPKVEKTAEEIRAEATRAEQLRIGEIRAMCDHFGQSDMVDQFVEDGKSIDEARKIVMEKMMERKPDGPGFRPTSVQVGAEEKEKFRSAAVDSILVRIGSVIEKPQPGAMELAASWPANLSGWPDSP